MQERVHQSRTAWSSTGGPTDCGLLSIRQGHDLVRAYPCHHAWQTKGDVQAAACLICLDIWRVIAAEKCCPVAVRVCLQLRAANNQAGNWRFIHWAVAVWG